MGRGEFGRARLTLLRHQPPQGQGFGRPEAGGDDIVDAQAIGLQFMIARERQQQAQLRAHPAERANRLRIVPCPALNRAQHQARGRLRGIAFGGVASDDVADLVAEHRRQLVVVLDQFQQAGGHTDLARWQDEGVGAGVLEHGVVPTAAGQARRLNDTAADAAHPFILRRIARHLLRPQRLAPGGVRLLDQGAVVHDQKLIASQALVVGATGHAESRQGGDDGGKLLQGEVLPALISSMGKVRPKRQPPAQGGGQRKTPRCFHRGVQPDLE
ncbi:hypothetical protein D3C85_1234720 [compost metagenome]